MGCLIVWCSWEYIGLAKSRLHVLYPGAPVFCSYRSRIEGERGEGVAVVFVSCPGERDYEAFNQLMAGGSILEASWYDGSMRFRLT